MTLHYIASDGNNVPRHQTSDIMSSQQKSSGESKGFMIVNAPYSVCSSPIVYHEDHQFIGQRGDMLAVEWLRAYLRLSSSTRTKCKLVRCQWPAYAAQQRPTIRSDMASRVRRAEEQDFGKRLPWSIPQFGHCGMAIENGEILNSCYPAFLLRGATRI